MKQLKAFGTYGIGAIVLLAILALPLLWIYGVAWVSEHLTRPVIGLSTLVLVVDILVLVPLSALRRLRPYTGALILASAALFAFATWLYSCVVTLELWGGFGLFVGLASAGMGVILTAALASLFKGEGAVLSMVVGMLFLTLISQIVGTKIRRSD